MRKKKWEENRNPPPISGTKHREECQDYFPGLVFLVIGFLTAACLATGFFAADAAFEAGFLAAAFAAGLTAALLDADFFAAGFAVAAAFAGGFEAALFVAGFFAAGFFSGAAFAAGIFLVGVFFAGALFFWAIGIPPFKPQWRRLETLLDEYPPK